ncbi:MAG TPA: sugar ABC transporter ATP-binding protein [Clostridiaceae bacterium]|nr:sugar ABC transporter ATP-binding protein [Clostridiaceae bacterium]
MSENILEIKHVTKSFPGVVALDDVSFNIKKGEIHALVGENGAGKSTLIKILSGAYSLDKGYLVLKGKNVKFNSPIEAIAQGISVVHQEIKLVGTLTVAENIFIGRLPLNKKTHLVNWNKLNHNARLLLDSIGSDIDEKEYVNNLSIAQQQLVEICKALSYNSEIIIMDEPSATLTYAELEILFTILRKLKEQKITIIYISHRLEEIFEIADTVTVLRDGKHIHTGDVNEFDRKKLISMMVGRELENEYPKEFAERGEPLLEVKNLNRPGKLKNISFTLYRGEILGIAGLVGSGRTEMARTIFGADKNKKNSGEIFIKGKKVEINSVQDATKYGIALIPEDRKTQGLVLLMSIKENVSMANIKRIISKGFLNRKKETDLANKFIDVLQIQAPDENFVVRNLSGGNQQKVVIAKWLAANSDILILDEPTRGVDVGAKAEIYKLLNTFIASGKGVIMISSDMPEIIGMCDRVLVFRDGTITGEFTREEVTQEKLLDCAIK